MKSFQYFETNSIQAPNFSMNPFELNDYCDFDVKRVYYINNPKGELKTGAHCHKIEEELFIMIQGQATMVIDKGKGLEEIELTGGKSACYVPAYVWHHFKNISKDAIILALSSTHYNSNREDYIEDYDEFKKTINEA